ncbi:MAG: sensor domain-containing protein [Kineosporiaceae bacterium]
MSPAVALSRDARFLLRTGLVGVGALPLAILVTASACLVVVMVGGPLLAVLLPPVRGLAGVQRRLVAGRTGRELDPPYAGPVPGAADDLVHRLQEPATWRDLAWLWVQSGLALPALLLWWAPRPAGALAGAVTAASESLLGRPPAGHLTTRPGPAPGAGYGLVGMRERITLLGGTMHAGPREPAGWEVSATLPVPPPAGAPAPGPPGTLSP